MLPPFQRVCATAERRAQPNESRVTALNNKDFDGIQRGNLRNLVTYLSASLRC
jgi:hypothetical protein